jgi:hypothetical protein
MSMWCYHEHRSCLLHFRHQLVNVQVTSAAAGCHNATYPAKCWSYSFSALFFHFPFVPPCSLKVCVRMNVYMLFAKNKALLRDCNSFTCMLYKSAQHICRTLYQKYYENLLDDFHFGLYQSKYNPYFNKAQMKYNIYFNVAQINSSS